MTNDYYEDLQMPPTKDEQIRKIVGSLSRRYMTKPSGTYLQSVIDTLSESCSVDEAKEVVDKLASTCFKKFPTIQDVRYRIREHRRFVDQMKKRTEQDDGYKKKIPEIPMKWETIFQMIRKNKINTPAFNFARKRLEISDDDLSDAYECWERGEVHEIIKEEMESII